MDEAQLTQSDRLREVAAVFFKLGIIAFGGPAAHIAMMEDEVVGKRKWMSRQHFLDLVGATNLIPGPNSTEMAIHCGFHRAGWPGLILAGICFILPATVITGFLAWFYVRFSTVPKVEPFLYGVKPAVIAIILGAIYKLGKEALKSWQLGVIGIAVIVISFLGVDEITAIISGGIVGTFWVYFTKKKGNGSLQSFLSIFSSKVILGKSNLIPLSILLGTTAGITSVSLLKLFFVFIKIGAVLFGSGYVLVAYLDSELVNKLGWLTRQELLDAIAIGQFTPGPVLSTATFIGYQIQGLLGAVVATIGIFLPSFLFVAMLNPIVPKLRKSRFASAFLDAVNISALGIMVAVIIKLGQNVLVDWKAWIMAILSAVTIFGLKRINPAFIVTGSSIMGYILFQLR